MIKLIRYASLLVFSLTLSATAAADQLKPVLTWMDSLVESGRVVGCMVQITQDGETVFLEAVGDRSPESDEDVEVDQIIRIYSMSKAITSTAVMQLVEQGRLGIDDPVSMHVPEFADIRVAIDGGLQPPRRPITIRDLLTHTTGLAYAFSAPPELVPHYENKLIPAGDLEEAMVIIANMPLAEEPGSTFVYGLNTDVLGRVVEVVSERPFETYLRKHIFEPLSMDSTGFASPPDTDVMPIVTPTDGELAVDVEHYASGTTIYKPRFQSGGAGLWSTIGDYTRFCQAIERDGELNGNRILRPETVVFMTQNQLGPGVKTVDGQRFGLGFGIPPAVETSTGPQGEGRLSWGGAASTYFFIDPKQDLTAVFATQQFPFNGELNDEFHRVVLECIAAPSSDIPPLSREQIMQLTVDEAKFELQIRAEARKQGDKHAPETQKRLRLEFLELLDFLRNQSGK
ncbi:MAG: serine hydrolase [Phycisphaerae bacterium]|nr:serine hydrolase [Phycisphaerae bacterium]|tara:strand:+ start:2550 stop:3917 length:1368 start_codon:yes stop_codon:yes gene_type:complete